MARVKSISGYIGYQQKTSYSSLCDASHLVPTHRLINVFFVFFRKDVVSPVPSFFLFRYRFSSAGPMNRIPIRFFFGAKQVRSSSIFYHLFE